MQPTYEIDGQEYIVQPMRRNHGLVVLIEGSDLEINLQDIDQCKAEVTVNGRSHLLYAMQLDNTLYVHADGRHHVINIIDEFENGVVDERDDGGSLKAPMPGVVEAVYVSEGDQVVVGDVVMLIESMKLQTEIKSAVAGTVDTVYKTAGSSFDKGALLVAIAVTAEKS
ncbi:MAG: acetyl-CoA carboxylase biotin carboxyl carrier protein subunit [Spongiibacteraceae bacterium]